MRVLRATVVLTTRADITDANDSLCTKMAELRNYLLSGGKTLRFVTLKELGVESGFSSYGLLGEHGKYESCVMVRIVVVCLCWAGDAIDSHF